MDARTLVGKTLFFILICVFVSGFSSVFGPENNLVGVIIIVLALTMLSRDLSVRPVWNLGVMCACTLAMGAFSFLSVWLGNPFAGAVLNFAFVFGACFYAMHDLNSPMHFPFLLGYAFMLSVPVAADGLPLRLLALVAGSVPPRVQGQEGARGDDRHLRRGGVAVRLGEGRRGRRHRQAGRALRQDGRLPLREAQVQVPCRSWGPW